MHVVKEHSVIVAHDRCTDNAGELGLLREAAAGGNLERFKGWVDIVWMRQR
jgi:hypothetical protein